MRQLFRLTPLERKNWEDNYIAAEIKGIHLSPVHESIEKIVAVINRIILPRYCTAVPVKFLVDDNMEKNAFALPYSTVVINRGFIELVQPTWDELAFVIAHESAHIFRLHTVDRPLIDLFHRGLFVDPVNRAAFTVATRRFVSCFVEYDADESAARYLRHCGFDPTAGQRLISKLQQNGVGFWNNLIQGTHPSTSSRINRLRRLTPYLDHKQYAN